MRITEETKAEAQRVLDYIDMYPHIHDQRVWFGQQAQIDNITESDLNVGQYPDLDTVVIDPDPNICNTSLCIAGTQRWLAEGRAGLNEFTYDEQAAVTKAAEALGLSNYETGDLFYCMDNTYARDMLMAVASGDEEKFKAVHKEADEKGFEADEEEFAI